MSCNLTKLKKSSSDWLNSEKAVTQSEQMRFSCFRALPGSAEALLNEVKNIVGLPFDSIV